MGQLGARWTREVQIPSPDYSPRISVLASQLAGGTSSDVLFNLSVPALCLKKKKGGGVGNYNYSGCFKGYVN